MRADKLRQLENILKQFKTVTRIETTPTFIKSKAYEFTLNNGTIITREKIVKGSKDGSAVIIVPYVGNEVLLVIEPRVFTRLGVGVGFPAGYIEPGEDPKLAALRELREETGLVPKDIEEVDAFYQDEGCSSAFNHVFVAHNCKRLYNQELDESEQVEYMSFRVEEVLELEKMGYISGCNSKIAIQKIIRR